MRKHNMQKPRRSAGVLALAAVLALAVTACSAPSAPVETSGPRELTIIKLGQLKVAATAPLYIADREGFFEEEGIYLQIEQFAGGAEILPALVAKQITGAFSNHVTTVSAVQAGVDFKCVTGSDSAPEDLPDTANLLIAADSDIRTVGDLKGKTIGVNNLRSILSLFATALIEENGLTLEDVEFVEIPFPNMGDTLAQDRVDAVTLVEPFNTVLQDQGIAQVLSPLYHPVAPGIELGCYGFSAEFIKGNPELVAGFVRAYERGKELASTDEELTFRAVSEWTGLDADAVRSITLSEWRPGISTEDLQTIADLMLKYGYINDPFDASKHVDDSFVE